jgi:predicted transcriptional regulator of viral defense system
MSDVDRPNLRALEAEAYGQGGYFDAAQARAHGVSRQLLDHHLRQGRYERIRRGLYRITGFPSAEHDDVREKWMAVGTARAVVAWESALALLDLSDSIPCEVHLLVPRRHRGLRRPPGVVIHTHPDGEHVDTVWRAGLPVTAPARTLVDVLDQVQPDQAVMAVSQAIRRGLVTPKQLRTEAARRRKEKVMEPLLAAAGSQ